MLVWFNDENNLNDALDKAIVIIMCKECFYLVIKIFYKINILLSAYCSTFNYSNKPNKL